MNLKKILAIVLAVVFAMSMMVVVASAYDGAGNGDPGYSNNGETDPGTGDNDETDPGTGDNGGEEPGDDEDEEERTIPLWLGIVLSISGIASMVFALTVWSAIAGALGLFFS